MATSQKPKINDKKIKLAEQKVQKILHKIEAVKLSSWYISQLSLHKRRGRHFLASSFLSTRSLLLIVGVIIAAYMAHVLISNFDSESCWLESPIDNRAAFRAPEDCSFCAGVSSVERASNLTADRFEQLLHEARPVVVSDGARGWRAMDAFSFDFLKQLYSSAGGLGRRTNDCFFFAYQSGFQSLQEVFEMDQARANLTEGEQPWYVGWNTCHEREARLLRQYYARPYFLPAAAESLAVDWLFMGGPGQGAHMHVDSVRHVSWQAQVRGGKRWQLAPPPECLYCCVSFSFTLQPGDILVVDTNRWYHRTSVLPGDLSITIGAEFD